MKANSKEVKLEFNLPDFDRRDIRIRLSDDMLWIKADKKHKSREKKKDFFHVESSHQRFYYHMTLPKIDFKKAKIDFKKGVLKITAPRK
ncbi:MAG: Hsp20/alpha crystallin family protein [Candidatus Pacearchaeota archaeon]|jgi:HSP20 family protein